MEMRILNPIKGFCQNNFTLHFEHCISCFSVFYLTSAVGNTTVIYFVLILNLKLRRSLNSIQVSPVLKNDIL
jgi:hypothetical protein